MKVEVRKGGRDVHSFDYSSGPTRDETTPPSKFSVLGETHLREGPSSGISVIFGSGQRKEKNTTN